jgi:hypothetical protein
MKRVKFLRKLLALWVLLCLTLPALAAGDSPVAVVSLVWGAVTIKHQNEDYKPARWLEPVFAGDQVKTSGADSKLLITFFNDNHQEVVGPDSNATAVDTTLNGSSVRKDAARNPFGAGGVENPFVYTHRLIQADFQNPPFSYDAEKQLLQARVRPTFPPSLFWQKSDNSLLQVYDYLGNSMWKKQLSGHSYVLTNEQAQAMPKGVNYWWDVTSGNQVLVAKYPFKLLTLPQYKWAEDQRHSFDSKRSTDQLQRSDWTDYLLVCSQLNYIDEALDLLYKMAEMDPNNPAIYRAMTRVYLAKKCPVHAQKAHDKELQLGGLDPVYP